MTFNHMSDEFKAKQRENIVAKKAAGVSAQHALRDLEMDCGRSNEEFAIDGVPLVEEVYDGHFDGGQAGSFEPNKRAPEAEVKAEEPNAVSPIAQPAAAEVKGRK